MTRENGTTKYLLCLCLLFLPTSVIANSKDLTFKEYLESANAHIKAYRHFPASSALKEATKLGGAKHPSLHMRLGILYYGLGLIPEAIAEGEKAVTLAPSSKWYKYDLAKFYFVDKQYDKAEGQLNSLLRLDPAFTLGYYYLAEIYFFKKQYDMSWLSLSRAKLLGHQDEILTDKLILDSSQPEEQFDSIAENDKLFRFIKVSTEEKAKTILGDISHGKLFENLELELKNENNGADFGVMMLSEFKDSIALSLKDKEPYSIPVLIQTGSDFRVIQRIVPFSPKIWQNVLTHAQKNTAPKEQEEIIVQLPKITPVQLPVKPADETTPLIVKESTVPDPKKIDTTESRDNGEQAGQFSTKLAAFYALENWKDTWETVDLEGYFASYSDNFIPEKDISRTTWEKKRTKSLTRPKYIHIELIDPVVEMLTKTQALITFKQTYESNSYSDSVIKTLTVEKELGGWKIIRERVIKEVIN